MDSVPDHSSYETSEEEEDHSDEGVSFARMKEPWRNEGFPSCFLGSTPFDGSFVESES